MDGSPVSTVKVFHGPTKDGTEVTGRERAVVLFAFRNGRDIGDYSLWNEEGEITATSQIKWLLEDQVKWLLEGQ